MEHIYIVQLREYVNLKKNIFKVGRTSLGFNNKGILHRLKGYPPGSVLHKVYEVRDCVTCETAVLKRLRMYSYLAENDGRESFEDTLENIISIIESTIETIKDTPKPPKKEISISIEIPKLKPLVCPIYDLPKNQCHFCMKLFSRNDNCTYHIKTCKMKNDHIRQLEIKLGIEYKHVSSKHCRYCNSFFTQSHNLIKHMNSCKAKQIYKQKLELKEMEFENKLRH